MSQLVKLEGAVRALAEARTLDEIKQVHDIATAAAEYARAAKLGLEAQNYAAEVKLRAERKAGELLAGLPKEQGTRNDLTSSNVRKSSDYRAVLDETETSYQQANRWQKIAAIDAEDFEQYVETTKANGTELTTTGALRIAKSIERAEQQAARRDQPFPTGVFEVVYADPPWSYNNSGFDQSAASQYPTMATEDICRLPVGEISDGRSVLFLWATSPLLPDALDVMAAWGFDYKASMVWAKNRAPGMGWWVQTYHELLLIGARGNSLHPLERPPSVITAGVSVHSRKPPEFYELIERMYTGPKVELFARIARDGWQTWGNEHV